MTFSATLADVGLLREAMSAIAEIIDETDIVVGREGLRLIAADRAVVAVVDFSLSRDAFSEYDCSSESRVGVNLINFLRVLRRAAPNDILKIALSGNRLELKLLGDSVRTFSLPIIDVSRQELPPLDKLSFTSTFDVMSDVLSSGIEDADLITDSLVFMASPEKVVLKADSESAGFDLELTPQSAGLRSFTGEAARARYSLDYLKRIIRARKLSDTVRISLANDYPMRIMFDVPGKAQLGVVLAPRRDE